jgi:uncharacterized membrane protein YukC
MKDFNWQLLSWWMWLLVAWTTIILVVYEEYFTALWFGVATIILLVVLVIWGLVYFYKEKERINNLFTGGKNETQN